MPATSVDARNSSWALPLLVKVLPVTVALMVVPTSASMSTVSSPALLSAFLIWLLSINRLTVLSAAVRLLRTRIVTPSKPSWPTGVTVPMRLLVILILPAVAPAPVKDSPRISIKIASSPMSLMSQLLIVRLRFFSCSPAKSPVRKLIAPRPVRPVPGLTTVPRIVQVSTTPVKLPLLF